MYIIITIVSSGDELGDENELAWTLIRKINQLFL